MIYKNIRSNKQSLLKIFGIAAIALFTTTQIKAMIATDKVSLGNIIVDATQSLKKAPRNYLRSLNQGIKESKEDLSILTQNPLLTETIIAEAIEKKENNLMQFCVCYNADMLQRLLLTVKLIDEVKTKHKDKNLPLTIVSLASGYMLQEYLIVVGLLMSGYTNINIVFIEPEYYIQKYGGDNGPQSFENMFKTQLGIFIKKPNIHLKKAPTITTSFFRNHTSYIQACKNNCNLKGDVFIMVDTHSCYMIENQQDFSSVNLCAFSLVNDSQPPLYGLVSVTNDLKMHLQLVQKNNTNLNSIASGFINQICTTIIKYKKSLQTIPDIISNAIKDKEFKNFIYIHGLGNRDSTISFWFEPNLAFLDVINNTAKSLDHCIIYGLGIPNKSKENQLLSTQHFCLDLAKPVLCPFAEMSTIFGTYLPTPVQQSGDFSFLVSL